MAQNNEQDNQLKRGAIGALPLVFLVIAAAAPLGASATNTPLIFGLGNGAAAPLDFVFIGIILILFSVGYTAMAAHVTNAGAFFTYISLGMGKKLGTAAGYIAVSAYNLLCVYLVSAGGTFASQIFEQELGVVIPWWVCAIIFAAIILLFSYLGIEGGTKFLMVCLALEVAVLAVVDISVVVQDGLAAYSMVSFSPETFFSGAPGLGVCFAFLCFIGFEATAIFGEETKNPRKTVPRATYAAVIVIGLVYSLSAWSMVAAYGPDAVMPIAQEDPAGMYYNVAVSHCGEAIGHIFYWLLIISNFASWMAAHNMCSRYLYAFGRVNLLPKALEKTNKHKSPFCAACVNIAFSLIAAFALALFQLDPYSQIGAICSAIAIVGIMLLELAVCIAVVMYMRKHNTDAGYGHNVFQTTIAPIVALIGMGYVLWLVLSNFSLLTGFESIGINVVLACLTIIIGVAGYFIAVNLDKKGKLADPQSIDVEDMEDAETLEKIEEHLEHKHLA